MFKFLKWMGRKCEEYGVYVGGILIVVVALKVYQPGLSIPPFNGDNVIALSYANTANPLAFFEKGLASFMPAYRPLPLLLIWLQYQIHGLRPALFFLFNQLALISCGLLVLIVVCARPYHSGYLKLAAAVAAFLFIIDPRAVSSLVWILERQSSLACLFGLFALLLATVSIDQRWKWPREIAIFFLLLFSSLCKEYGLAFAACVVLFVWIEGSRSKLGMILAAVGAVAAYGLMRIFLAGGAIAPYCEEMGFFFKSNFVCYDQLDSANKLAQFAYNILATFLGTLFPSIFNSGLGQINQHPSPVSLLMDLVVFLPALLAWIKLPRRTLPFLGLIVFNSFLNFMLFRGRNQLVGMTGLYISFSLGLAFLLDFLVNHRNAHEFWFVTIRVATVVLLLWLAASHSLSMNSSLDQTRQNYFNRDPCTVYQASSKDISFRMVIEIKSIYRLKAPTCK